MKRGAPTYAFVWYSPASWPRLKATAADAETLEDTYDEWHAKAESAFKTFRRQGMWLEKVEIDIDALLTWCEAHGQPPDAAARSTYAAQLLQQRDQGQTRIQTEPTAKTKRSGQHARSKGLSPKAQETAMAAEQLYRQARLPIDEITNLLKISKSTLYRYLRHRGVQIEGRRR